MSLRTVKLEDIVANKWRDLNLYPIDDDQVGRLMESIGDIGVFGAIPGRPTADGKIEQACHHHVTEAARRCGIATIAIDVQDRTDEQMLRLMIAENATQRGHNPGSTLDSVNAVVRHIAWKLYVTGWNETDFGYAPEIRSVIEAGNDEIGVPLIQHYAQGLTRYEIDGALASLKSGGEYTRAVEDAIAEGQRQAREEIERLERERWEAEERAAQEEEEEQRRLLEAEAATLREEEAAAARALKTAQDAANEEAKRKVTFDAKVATLFANQSQLDTFRKLVTNERYNKYVPLNKQYKLAQDIVKAARTWDSDRENGQVTSAFIKHYLGNLLLNGGKYVRKVQEEDRRTYERGQHLDEALKIIDEGDQLLHEGVRKAVQEMRDGAQLPPLFHQFLNKLQVSFDLAMRTLRDASGITTTTSQIIEGEVIDLKQANLLRRPL